MQKGHSIDSYQLDTEKTQLCELGDIALKVVRSEA